ncbi:TolB domain-containing protein [Pseudogracilibacillus auburnensis]|uniref:TolB domain-containing protein n=1 Tax=Pseudogracilibacillus auburnensis TaxID=1494959 RepID=UPI001A970589|nr:TolB domain-containing protein [Pseudogracilibacillus auburnensis]MBO1003999.1 TolB domain-containing protein [Pseudogracilibacillus auburnensis]
MSKLFRLVIMLCILFPAITKAENNISDVKIAFIRDGYLWMKVEDKENQIVKAALHTPKWSYDGKYLLYQKEAQSIFNYKETQTELWVYELETQKHYKIFYDAQNPKWSPTENILAFQDRGVLNISDLKNFNNVALGVADYEWHPNGKGFIASSSADLHPDGWTNPIIYTISIESGFQNIAELKKDIKELFVIPKQVSKGNVDVMSIDAHSFTYSPNGKWISFIVSPTASLGMDSDMLSVLSADGNKFEPIDEVALGFPNKWAPTKNILGFIAGEGRIVFGFKNKDMKITELPAYQSLNLTPPHFVDMDFTWMEDSSIIVSRVPESEWSNKAEKRPKPTLFNLSLEGKEQLKITAPPKDRGDYQPEYLPTIHRITWFRKNDLAELKGDLWVSDPNGKNAKIWIANIELYDFYYYKK